MPRRIQTTETSFEIIDLIKQLEGATMTEISDRLGLANSTVHGHLKTLEENQLLVKEGNEYHLGLQFFHYGNFTKQRKPEYQFAQEHVGRLANDTNENANFCVEEHGQIIVLNGASAADDPAYDIGNVFDMHVSAVGKALFAEMSDEEISTVIEEWGLPEYTENTITDRETLFEEIKEIRQTGYAFNHEEMFIGLSAVGVTVKYPDSSVLGALSVGGPTYRTDGRKLEEEFLEIILDVKREFESDIRSLYDSEISE